MVLSVIISATARITRHVIHKPENVSVNEAGWDEHAIRNVQQDIMGKIVKKNVQKICHQRQLAIMSRVNLSAVQDTSESHVIIHAKREHLVKIVNKSVDVKMAVNVHTLMEFATAYQDGQETFVKILAPMQLGGIIASINASALTTLVVANLMEFAFVSLVLWVKSVKKFVPKDFTVPTVLRFAAAIENQIRFAIQLTVVFASQDIRETIVTSH